MATMRMYDLIISLKHIGGSMKKIVVLAVACMLLSSAAAQSAENVAAKIPVTTVSDEARKEFIEGLVLADNLETAKSLAHFDKAIALDPSFATAYLNRANVSLTMKDFLENMNGAVSHKDAASEGERLMILATQAGANARFEQERAYLEKLVSLYPNDERARLTLGTFFFGQQEYDSAISQLVRSVRLADKFAPSYNMLGYAYRQAGQYENAETAFKKYTELIPEDANPYDSYAELLLKMGRFDESITNYKKALAIDPNFASSEIGLTMNFLYQGKPGLAAQEAHHLYEIARNEGEQRQAYFVLAVVDADAGNMDAALKDFEAELEVGKKINDVVGMAGDVAAQANVLLESGKPDDAIAAYRRSLHLITHSDLSPEIKANMVRISHYNEAYAALAKGDLNKAKEEKETFENMTEQAKNESQMRFVHELAGSIALAEKDGNKAVNELLQSNLQDAYNLYRLAQAYKLKGDKERAREYSKMAAEFNGLPSLNYAFVRLNAEKMSINQ